MSFCFGLCSRTFLWLLAAGTRRGDKNSFIFSSSDLLAALAEYLSACSRPRRFYYFRPYCVLSPSHPLNEANGAVLQIVGEFLVCSEVSCCAVSVDSRQEVGSWITSHPAQPPPCCSQLQTFSRVNWSKFSRMKTRQSLALFYCCILLHLPHIWKETKRLW